MPRLAPVTSCESSTTATSARSLSQAKTLAVAYPVGMPALKTLKKSRVVLWRGNPDCQAAHDFLRTRLLAVATPLPAHTAHLSRRTQGNLGEFMAFCVGTDFAFPTRFFTPFAANAHSPVSDISRPDADILWLHINRDPSKDKLVVHEVKTTIVPSLSLARGLVADYKKLFGVDPALTLHSRLLWLANKVEWELRKPEWCSRIHALAGDSPNTSTRIRLVPTLVHERHKGKPIARLLAVREVVSTFGWDPNQIKPWSIAVDDLQDRLLRLSRGEA